MYIFIDEELLFWVFGVGDGVVGFNYGNDMVYVGIILVGGILWWGWEYVGEEFSREYCV